MYITLRRRKMVEIPKKIYLSKEDIEKLKETEPILDWIAEELARAERAGIDVEDLKKEYERLVRQKEGLIREYAPPEMRSE